MKLPSYMTQVTKTSKTIALIMFVLLPFIGFYVGRKFATQTYRYTPANEDTEAANKSKFSLYKGEQDKDDKSSYKYDLVKKDADGQETTIFSVTNWNGFGYQVSADQKYIAVIIYGESMGDETLTLIDSNGKVLKDFGRMDSPQSLQPIKWIEHTYWISEGVPIGEPAGVIRIDAETLEFETFQKRN